MSFSRDWKLPDAEPMSYAGQCEPLEREAPCLWDAKRTTGRKLLDAIHEYGDSTRARKYPDVWEAICLEYAEREADHRSGRGDYLRDQAKDRRAEERAERGAP